MGHLDTVFGHGVAVGVEGEVHVLQEEGQQVGAFEPAIETLVGDNFLPDLTLLAAG